MTRRVTERDERMSLQPVTARSWALFACAAAAVATAGDLAMLWVVNARRPELALAEGPAALLSIGCWLGVASIPVYAAGYAAAAKLVDETRPGSVRVIVVGGAIAAVTGALIHYLTARVVAARIATGAPGLDPFAELSSEILLLVLWAVASFAVVVASVAFATGVRPRHGKLLACANPALLTVTISVLGLASVVTRSFLAPAAPNLAHVLFFGICASRLAREARGRLSGSA